jgi:methylated-DNA-[protein]-cysteine S-methyltransferase
MRRHTVIDSPVGPLTIVGTADVVTAVLMDDQRHHPGPSALGEPDGATPAAPALRAAAEQLGAYFAGELTEFDLPLAAEGTAFQRRVWSVLATIPYGETRTYGEVAEALGAPGAARAVGAANGRNPIGIVVPCHRVVGADGSLTGYGGGLDRKQRLLTHEREVLAGLHGRSTTVPAGR